MAAQEPSGKEGNKTVAPFSVDGKTAVVTGAGSGIYIFILYIHTLLDLLQPTNSQKKRHKPRFRRSPPLAKLLRPNRRPNPPPRSPSPNRKIHTFHQRSKQRAPRPLPKNRCNPLAQPKRNVHNRNPRIHTHRHPLPRRRNLRPLLE
jgi:hypothetical protein